MPIRPRRVVLATARVDRLDGNLLHLHRAITAARPDLEVVTLLEPYAYGLAGKLAYLARMCRAMVALRTARWFIVDNAYLPIHVAPHRRGTTVVQVWHAVGALKRFGVDTAIPLDEPEATFLHRYYDAVVVAADAWREPYAAALRTPFERVHAIGAPRTDLFIDEAALAAARQRVLAEHPSLAGRRIVLYAPTFRGRGRRKRDPQALDGRRLRSLLPEGYLLILKGHPNLDPSGTSSDGFDLVIDHRAELNDLLAATDVLVTDYSSSVFEFALLRRPIVLLVDDVAAYRTDPGFYLEPEAAGIGAIAHDSDEVARAILAAQVDEVASEAFIDRYLTACDGRASERFVTRFLGDRAP
ncbi:MAG: CDP-glycerol glycerophosphotransferase family protein [Candidatus Limnocylindrales bacterium]